MANDNLICYTFNEYMLDDEDADRHVTTNIKELLDKYPAIEVLMLLKSPPLGADSASIKFKITRHSFLKGNKCKKYFPDLISFENEASAP